HGGHAGGGQPLDGRPFLAGTQNGGLQGEEILEDLPPANAAMDLDEIASPRDLGAQGAAPLQFAVHLTLQTLHFDEGILASPEGFEGFAEKQFHHYSGRRRAQGRCARMMSAARSGMEWISAVCAQASALRPQACRCAGSASIAASDRSRSA